LVTDGASDRALLPILTWLLRQHSLRAFQPQWADLRALRHPPKSLEEKISASLELYPCDLLFVHRDAEREPRDVRVAEIRRCLKAHAQPPTVCVVPVRMQEAWLLFDEATLRLAADNPRGESRLSLPPLHRLEEIPDPKGLLHELLYQASGLRPGRLSRFHPAARTHRVAELIEDFSPLRGLPAFQALEIEVSTLMKERRWV
jgi:hypothetical protein